jgi:hypothetical protein
MHQCNSNFRAEAKMATLTKSGFQSRRVMLWRSKVKRVSVRRRPKKQMRVIEDARRRCAGDLAPVRLEKRKSARWSRRNQDTRRKALPYPSIKIADDM